MSDINPEWVEKAAKAASAAVGCGCCAEPTPGEFYNFDDPRASWAAHLALTAVIDDIRVEAWDEGFGTGSTHGIAYQAGDDDALSCPRGANPYREQDGAES